MKKNTDIKNKIFSFIKFGNKDNMIDFIENGTIYFNTIEYFKKLEEQIARGDKYEGTTRIQNFHESDNYTLTITDPETKKEIKIKNSKIHYHQSLNDIKGNLFSMYCLKTPELLAKDFKIDQKVKNFGSHFVMIRDSDKFLELVSKELEKQNIPFKGKLVNYYQKEKINGEITPFDKTTEYEYQKEYRIVLFSNEIKPIIIQIGNLRKIAEIFEIKVIDKIKFKWEKKTV
ncbi:hypothetical protein [Polaribacter sp. NJDZ03]|uniref:hypothetical protein n=1 Tax=Polaribacter sp. NJDZ03 TaxID=2855841 RepID=UPI001C49E38F|nr:hypothetical protein [Polaribacter sp. NJDZ03]